MSNKVDNSLKIITHIDNLKQLLPGHEILEKDANRS